MKPLKRVLWLALCLCMVMSLFTMSTSAADYINKITVTVNEPAAGFKPAKATTSSTAGSEVRDTQWTGDFDANGCFIGGNTYTITVTLGIKDDVDKYFKQGTQASSYTINGKKAELVSHSKTKVVMKATLTAATSSNVTAASLKVAEPNVGAKPADATSLSEGVKVSKTEWIGALNNGTVLEGVSYTVRCTLVPSISSAKLKLEEGEKVTVNGCPAIVVSSNANQAVIEFPFAPAIKQVPAVADEGVLRNAQFYYNKPLVGDKPPMHIAVAQSGALYITNINWSGDFDENGCFKAGKTYTLEFIVRVRSGVNMTIPNSSNVNVRNYQLNGSRLTVATAYDNTGGKAIRFSTNVYIDLPRDLVDIKDLYTIEQADALENTRNAQKYGDLILNNASMEKYIADHRITAKMYPVDSVLYLDIPEMLYATRLLVDYPADNDSSEGSGKALDLLPNITELWLSPEMDVKKWISNMADHTPFGYEGTNLGPNCWSNFTLYISGDKHAASSVNKLLGTSGGKIRVLLYSGDVYTAFEKAGKGEQVGREWCTKHEYTYKRAHPDCVMKYATCQNATWYCYSCEHCGKPELDINHIFKMSLNGSQTATDVSGRITHSMTQVIDPKHLIGRNADGDLIYAESCRWCGYNEKQITLLDDLTEAQYNYSYGTKGLTLQQYREVIKESWDKSILPQVLQSTVEDCRLGYFVVEAENEITATVRASYSNNVRLAAQEGLVDLTLMGNDYNKEMTRLQFCSVAVRLAEKMAGVSITPAPATTFTDCTNEYALKAYAAGITTGQTATTFNPNGTLTRQQMATFIYRALMWVRDNSAIRYTPYESKLAGYTDADLLRSYAKEPMAFMNALGLVNGNTATTLNPNGNCTIQQAITVAYRSLNADMIGWYQAYQWYWDGDRYYLIPGAKMEFSDLSFASGDRVWVTGVEGDSRNWLVVDSPDIDYSNTTMYLNASDFKPIKALKADDVERYYYYIPQ